MAASNEVRFRIGADTSALSRGFKQARDVASAASDQIRKKFDLKESFKSGVLALGLSIEKIAEKVAEIWTGGAQESWRAGLEAATEAERIIEEATAKRLSTLRQIEQLERKLANAPKDAEDATPRTETKTLPKSFNIFSGRMEGGGTVQRPIETEAQAHERAMTATAKRLADEAKLDALKEKRDRDAERIAAARRGLDAIGLSDQERYNAALKEADIAGAKLAEARKKRADTAELELAFIEKLKEAKQQLVEIDKQNTEAQEKLAEEEKKRAEDAARDAKLVRETDEKIHDIEAEAAALDETRGEKVARLRNEANEQLARSRDLTRDLDDRERSRVSAAEKLREAAREEHDWHKKTLSLQEVANLAGNRANGILAKRIQQLHAQADAAQARGNLTRADQLRDRALGAEEALEKGMRSRRGLSLIDQARAHNQALANGDLGAGAANIFDPRHTFGPDENATPPSAWDLRYGGAIRARHDAMTTAIEARKNAMDRAINQRKAALSIGAEFSQRLADSAEGVKPSAQTNPGAEAATQVISAVESCKQTLDKIAGYLQPTE